MDPWKKPRMEQLVDIIVGDIHDAPTPCQCLRQSTVTQPVRRLSIRDLLPSSQGETGVHQALVNGGYGPDAARLASEIPRAAIGLGYSAGGTCYGRPFGHAGRGFDMYLVDEAA